MNGKRRLPIVLLSVWFAGCGQGPDEPPLVPVSGTVTLDDKPLSGALVTFIPTGNTKGTDVSGRTDRDGRYKLVTPKGRAGAAAGTYRVTISRLLRPDGSEYLPDPAVPPVEAPARESLPPHYSDPERTRLTATVPEAGATADFPLKRGK